jgi:hypothetical protein
VRTDDRYPGNTGLDTKAPSSKTKSDLPFTGSGILHVDDAESDALLQSFAPGACAVRGSEGRIAQIPTCRTPSFPSARHASIRNETLSGALNIGILGFRAGPPVPL